MEKLLTPEELGQVLGLSTQTIYNRRAQGLSLPPAIKWGRMLRFRQQDVADWIALRVENEPLPGVVVQQKRGRPTKAAALSRK